MELRRWHLIDKREGKGPVLIMLILYKEGAEQPVQRYPQNENNDQQYLETDCLLPSRSFIVV